MKGQEILISVIVPVYNVECYFERCMDTVLNQTYGNIEIILIDDGSTDKSGKLCDAYAKKDARVKVFHQKNNGQAAARNYALTVAKGDYVAYIDSDDYLSLQYLDVLMHNALIYNADIVQCYVQKFWNDRKKEIVRIKNENIEIYNASEALKEFCYQRKFYAGPWAKIIKKSLMDGLEYPVNTGYEDMAVMYRLLGKAQKIVLVPEVMYYYRQHQASTMHNVFSDKKIDRIRIAEQFKSYIDQNYPENSIAVKTRYLLANLQLLMDIPYGRKYDFLKRKVSKNIRSVRSDVIKDRQSKNSIQFMAMASYMGIVPLMVLGRLYKKIFN